MEMTKEEQLEMLFRIRSWSTEMHVIAKTQEEQVRTLIEALQDGRPAPQPIDESTQYPTGVDVSKHQGPVDWAQFRKEGHAFAYIKLTEGVGYVDPRAHENNDGARGAGILRGFYHFGTWHNMDERNPGKDAVAEAQSFAHHAGDHGWDIPPVLDLEFDRREDDRIPKEKITDWAVAFCDEFKVITGTYPMIYTSSGFDYRLGRPKDLRRFCLWQADYQFRPAGTKLGRQPKDDGIRKHGWDWLFWQHTNKLPTKAVSRGVVDGNVYNGTLAELRALSRSLDGGVHGSAG